MIHLKIKKILKKLLPKKILDILILAWRKTYVNIQNKIINIKYKKMSTKETFTYIFNENKWWSNESVSWPGSTINWTIHLKEWINRIIKQYNINSFIDAPCGDVNWIEPEKIWIKYIWCDIVENIIIKNRKKFKSENIIFTSLDITHDKLPDWDIIHCRECLQHLSYENILGFLSNLKKSNIKYLLTTTHIWWLNKNIIDWKYFQINLEEEPFKLPKPELLLEEKERNIVTWEKKYLWLWEVKNLK